jgi:hypothetical protein
MLQSVRIAQFREDFLSALSAPLRAPREQGNLVAAGRAGSYWSFMSHSHGSQLWCFPLENPAAGAIPIKVNQDNRIKSGLIKANQGKNSGATRSSSSSFVTSFCLARLARQWRIGWRDDLVRLPGLTRFERKAGKALIMEAIL